MDRPLAESITLQGDEKDDEATFEISDFVHGNGTRRLLLIGAGSDLDWGTCSVTIDEARRLRDWLHSHPDLSAPDDPTGYRALRPEAT